MAVCKSFCFAFGMDCKAPLMVKGNNDPYPLPSKLIEILTLLLFWFSTFILINSSELLQTLVMCFSKFKLVVICCRRIYYNDSILSTVLSDSATVAFNIDTYIKWSKHFTDQATELTCINAEVITEGCSWENSNASLIVRKLCQEPSIVNCEMEDIICARHGDSQPRNSIWKTALSYAKVLEIFFRYERVWCN